MAPTAAVAAEAEARTPLVELAIYEEIELAPDIAVIGAGVTTEAPSAVEAMRRNSSEMRRVIERIKALGVAEKDIQTSGRSEEHTSELQALMRISYAVFCLHNKTTQKRNTRRDE